MFEWLMHLWQLYREWAPGILLGVLVFGLAVATTGCGISAGNLRNEMNEDAEVRHERLYQYGERAGSVYYPDKPTTTEVVHGLTSEFGWTERAFDLPGHAGRCVLLTNEALKRQIVVSRGTDNLTNWKVDATYIKDWEETLGCHLHRGFKNAAYETWEAVKAFVHREEGWTISFTGHSLGGAIAVICAMFAYVEALDVTSVVTFGQPKVTNKEGAEKWDYLLDVTRVVHSSDGVPLLPFTKPSDLWDDGRFWHFGVEMLVDDDGGVETFTSAGAMKSGHTSYWYQLLTFQRVPLLSSMNHPMAKYLKALWYWVPRSYRKVKAQSRRNSRRLTK